jgi:hypothetical protein
MSDLTREAIIQSARDAAKKHDGPLSKSKFVQLTGYSDYHIYRLFPEGGWSEIRRLASVDRHPNDNDPLSDEELLEEYHRVVSTLETLPSWHLFESMSNFSATTLRKRFGNNREVRLRYRAWLEKHFPESPLLALVPPDLKRERDLAFASSIQKAFPTRWQKSGGMEYGAPINFRGLQHAPINEQGVVYLFGMVSSELGLIVEAIQSAFPDCEAKRCVDSRLDRWQRVRIEFEFLSRNFRDHGHNPDGCDLIVCWEHNWPECPIEVIDLKTVIGNLGR